MIDVFPYHNLPVAVFGLGRSGMAAARALIASEADVWAWDDDKGARKRAADEGVPLVDLYACDWEELPSLLLSPGIPHDHPAPHKIVELARAAGTEVINDVELLARAQRDASYIGITATNGKSTTTALIGHILQTSGHDAEVGGNLGIPVLELYPLGQEGTYVLEMSSYQLERTVSITFDIAVLLNISADHLERHGGMDGYIAAKKLIFHRQTKPRTAVVGVDDEFCRAIADELKQADEQVVIPISGSEHAPGGVYFIDGVLYDDTEDQETPVCDLTGIASLPGVHNRQNAAAAYAVAKAAGVSQHAVLACIQSYPGLAHRQEPVSIVNGIGYVNDSKATNADAAARALACYENIYWIAGGRPKEGSIKAVEPHLGNVRYAYLIGEAALEFSLALNSRVRFDISGDLATAVKAANEQAKKDKLANAVVMLSPACASFDQFTDFEARGDTFRDIIESLPGKHLDPLEAPGLFPGTGGGPKDGEEF